MEIQQLAVVFLDHPGPGRLDRSLIAAILALDRLGHVDAAKLFDAVIKHPAVEHIAPGVRKRPEDGRHVGADGLTFRARSALASTPLELLPHPGILNRFGIQVADPLLGHDSPPLAPTTRAPGRTLGIRRPRTTAG